MRDAFYRKVEGRTYAAPQYGKEIILTVGELICMIELFQLFMALI